MKARVIPGLVLLWGAVALAGCASVGRVAKPASPVPAKLNEVVRANPKWIRFQTYLQKLAQSVQTQWQRILQDEDTYPDSGTQVSVTFRLGADGVVREIVGVTGDAGNAAEKSCVMAVGAKSPYAPWTEEMKALLGESQEITFTFHYL